MSTAKRPHRLLKQYTMPRRRGACLRRRWRRSRRQCARCAGSPPLACTPLQQRPHQCSWKHTRRCSHRRPPNAASSPLCCCPGLQGEQHDPAAVPTPYAWKLYFACLAATSCHAHRMSDVLDLMRQLGAPPQVRAWLGHGGCAVALCACGAHEAVQKKTPWLRVMSHLCAFAPGCRPPVLSWRFARWPGKASVCLPTPRFSR